MKTEAVKTQAVDDDLFSSPKSPSVPDAQRDSTMRPKLTLSEEKEAIDKKPKKDLPGSVIGSEKTKVASDKEPFSLGGKPPPLSLADEDNEEDDLFGISHKSKQITSGARTAPNSATNDNNKETGASKSEFRQTSANTEPVTSKGNPPSVKSGVEVSERKETSSRVNLPEDDDIFASRSFKTASANQSTLDAKHDKSAAIDDDEDDLFGGKGMLSSSKQASKTKMQDAKVLSSEKPKPPSSTLSMKNDADDDLFGTKALIKPTAPAVTERTAVLAASEENSAKKLGKVLLSSDDDDIFSVPKNASASSAVKTKAASTVKAAQDAEDDDDIFANSSLAPKGQCICCYVS